MEVAESIAGRRLQRSKRFIDLCREALTARARGACCHGEEQLPRRPRRPIAVIVRLEKLVLSLPTDASETDGDRFVAEAPHDRRGDHVRRPLARIDPRRGRGSATVADLEAWQALTDGLHGAAPGTV